MMVNVYDVIVTSSIKPFSAILNSVLLKIANFVT